MRNAVAIGLVALVALDCKHDGHKKGGKRETKAEEREIEMETFAMPIPSCTCKLAHADVTLHAPKAGNVLWWVGVDREDADELDELSISRRLGKNVIPPSEYPARLAIACDADVLVLVREDHAAGWNVPHDESGDVVPVWSITLPAPLDVTGIDAQLVKGANVEVGCTTLSSPGHAANASSSVTVPLRNAAPVTLSLRDGKIR
jgi:hypothetical protein